MNGHVMKTILITNTSSSGLRWTIIACYVVLTLVCAIPGSAVLRLFLRFRSNNKNSHFWFTLIILVCSVPIGTLTCVCGILRLTLPKASAELAAVTMSSLGTFGSSMSSFMVVQVSAELCILITRPSVHAKIYNERNTFCVITASSIITIGFLTHLIIIPSTIKQYSIFAISILITYTSAIILASFLTIRYVKSMEKRLAASAFDLKTAKTSVRSIRTTTILMVCYYIFYTPITSAYFVMTWTNAEEFSRDYMVICLFICHLDSGINIIIYGVRLPEIRKYVSKRFCWSQSPIRLLQTRKHNQETIEFRVQTGLETNMRFY